MADFTTSYINIIPIWEGEYWEDVAGDRGGETAFGICRMFLDSHSAIYDDYPQLRGYGNLKNMNREIAEKLYKKYFWQDFMDSFSQKIADKIFSANVNFGMGYGIKLLQMAIRASSGIVLVIDGCAGQKTLEAYRNAPEMPLLSAYRSEMAGRYRYLVAKNPSLDKFLGGWLNRAYA